MEAPKDYFEQTSTLPDRMLETQLSAIAQLEQYYEAYRKSLGHLFT